MDINAVTFLIGRIMFGGFFIASGLNHFTKRAMYTQYAASKHVPSPGASIVVSGLMLVLGGASVLFGLWPRIGLVLILLFLALVTPKMHNFWTISDPNQRMAETVNLMKNLALFGAALLIQGIWPASAPFTISQ
jgi:putative oxidoreductase